MKIVKSFSIEEDLYQRFDDITKELNINKSSFVENKISDFVKEKNNILSNIYTTITKWSPVMDCLGITNMEQRKKISLYAEHSTELIIKNFEFTSKNHIYTPMEIKILSKIDHNRFEIISTPNIEMDNKIYCSSDVMNRFTINVNDFQSVGKEDFCDIKEFQDLVIDKTVDFFNELLKKCEKIYFYLVIGMIYTRKKSDLNKLDVDILTRGIFYNELKM